MKSLNQIILECLKDGMEVSFMNSDKGLRVQCRILGAVNYGASEVGEFSSMAETAEKAKESLRKSLGKK